MKLLIHQTISEKGKYINEMYCIANCKTNYPDQHRSYCNSHSRHTFAESPWVALIIMWSSTFPIWSTCAESEFRAKTHPKRIVRKDLANSKTKNRSEYAQCPRK